MFVITVLVVYMLEDRKRFSQNYYRDLPNTHGKGVNILVQLVKQTYGLNDHIISTVHVEFYLGTRVAVTKTQLCLFQTIVFDTLEHFCEVQANATKLGVERSGDRDTLLGWESEIYCRLADLISEIKINK